MDMPDVVDEILDHIENIDFSKTDYLCSLFETTIRYLGGLLSGYDLLKDSYMNVDVRPISPWGCAVTKYRNADTALV